MAVEATVSYWPSRNLEDECVLEKQQDSGGKRSPHFAVLYVKCSFIVRIPLRAEKNSCLRIPL